jgi:hypothetical protein
MSFAVKSFRDITDNLVLYSDDGQMDDIISEHLSQEFTSNVKLLLRDFLKLIKVLAIYPADNPLPTKMRRSLCSRFTEIVNEFGGLSFNIQPDRIYFNKEEVFCDRGAEERLAGLFFDAGIIQLKLLAGLTEEEIDSFFGLLKDFMNDRSPERDLVSVLWQEQLVSIKYRTVDDLALDEQQTDMMIREICSTYDDDSSGSWGIDVNEISLDETEDESSASSLPSGAIEDAKQMGHSLEPAATDSQSIQSLLTNSYTPAEEEQKEINRLLAENKNFDPFRSVTRTLLEILDQWNDLKPYTETIGICEKVLDQILNTGEFSAAADFVHSLRSRQESMPPEKKNYAERLTGLLRRAGDQNRIERLTEIINTQETIDTDAVELYLESLGWECLPHITGMLGNLVSKKARLTICDYLARRGGDHLGIIANGIRDKRWYVVRNTVMILGQIGGEKVIEYFAATAGHSDQRVRAETFQALENMHSDRALDLLTRFLTDADPALREMALTSLGRIGGRRPFEAVGDVIRSQTFRDFTLDEQEQYLIVFSHLGGNEVTDFLASIIGSAGWLPSSTKMRYRLAALKAMAYNKSDEAEKLLLSYTGSRRKWLRDAAAAAMEYRRKLMYNGGSIGDAAHD